MATSPSINIPNPLFDQGVTHAASNSNSTNPANSAMQHHHQQHQQLLLIKRQIKSHYQTCMISCDLFIESLNFNEFKNLGDNSLARELHDQLLMMKNANDKWLLKSDHKSALIQENEMKKLIHISDRIQSAFQLLSVMTMKQKQQHQQSKTILKQPFPYSVKTNTHLQSAPTPLQPSKVVLQQIQLPLTPKLSWDTDQEDDDGQSSTDNYPVFCTSVPVEAIQSPKTIPALHLNTRVYGEQLTNQDENGVDSLMNDIYLRWNDIKSAHSPSDSDHAEPFTHHHKKHVLEKEAAATSPQTPANSYASTPSTPAAAVTKTSPNEDGAELDEMDDAYHVVLLDEEKAKDDSFNDDPLSDLLDSIEITPRVQAFPEQILLVDQSPVALAVNNTLQELPPIAPSKLPTYSPPKRSKNYFTTPPAEWQNLPVLKSTMTSALARLLPAHSLLSSSRSSTSNQQQEYIQHCQTIHDLLLHTLSIYPPHIYPPSPLKSRLQWSRDKCSSLCGSLALFLRKSSSVLGSRGDDALLVCAQDIEKEFCMELVPVLTAIQLTLVAGHVHQSLSS